MKSCDFYSPIHIVSVDNLIWKGLFLSKTSKSGSSTHYQLSLITATKMILPRE